MPVFFDSYTEIGPRNSKHPAERWSLEHLLEDMEHGAISGALVAHTQSLMYDPMKANRRLVKQLEPYPQLLPVRNLLPDGTGEMPAWEDLDRELSASKVAALAIHPQTNRWSIHSRRGRELLAWLEQRPEPLLLSWVELEGYQELAFLMETFPALDGAPAGAAPLAGVQAGIYFPRPYGLILSIHAL